MRFSIFRAALTLAVLVTGVGCATESISMNQQERYFSRAQSETGRIKNYVERYSWAKEKSDEYRILVEESEAELTQLRVEIAQLRDINKKRAKELQGLAKEADTLNKSMATQKTALDQAKAKLKKEQAELTGLKKQDVGVSSQNAALKARIKAAQLKHPQAKLRLERLLRSLGN